MRKGLTDLHRHLDGSLRPSTVVELARERGLSVPTDLAFHAGMGLPEALSRFAFTLSLLQEPAAVRRVAAEICEDAAWEGVSTLEIRFAPQLHRGAGLDTIVEAALEGIEGRAGLILCGLYGEDPALLMRLVELGANREGVVGIDLAGGPAPAHRYGMVDYAPAYRRAGELGLGRTVHAGEGRPPSEIRVAIEQLGAERIGHGTTLLDDEAVVDLVMESGVTIEACPTSNWHVGAIPSIAAHPLPLWLDRGLKVCVNADNTQLSETDAPTELRRVAAMPGMSTEKLARLVANGHAAAFRKRGSWGGEA